MSANQDTEIERGVPPPATMKEKILAIYPIDRMSIGDSFIVKNADRQGGHWWYDERARMHLVAKKIGVKLTTKMAEHGNVRVWRIA